MLAINWLVPAEIPNEQGRPMYDYHKFERMHVVIPKGDENKQLCIDLCNRHDSIWMVPGTEEEEA